MSRIVVVVEHEAGRVKEASLELITLARELRDEAGWPIVAVTLGADDAAAHDLARRTGESVVAVTHPLLADYTADGWVAALSLLVQREKPEVVLATHGPQGWDWAARLALRCGGSTASECTSAEHRAGQTAFLRKAFNGKLDMRFHLEKAPRVATVQRGARAAAPGGGATGSVTGFQPDLADSAIRARFAGLKAGPPGKLDLAQADVIVSGGRALGGPEKFEIIRALAEALGGQVGASRPVTDSGWLPPEHQVGSSGVTVKPKLYVACGISGAIQHVVGMKGSDFIVAINKDPRAPIFEVAHVGAVGDLFEIVPALTAAVKEAKAR